MKTIENTHGRVSRLWRMSALALASVLIASTWMVPAQASAITRKEVIRRGHAWVRRGVIYSQSRYYRGYRRDCSGFVSMAWRAKRSYTTRTIHRIARRVKIKNLRPGDAVLTPGHVALFVKWKSKRHRTYYAMEEASWGKPAFHRVRRIGRNAKGLRYRKIRRPVLVASAPASAAPAATGTVDAAAHSMTDAEMAAMPTVAPSIAPTGSLDTTLTWANTDPMSLFN